MVAFGACKGQNPYSATQENDDNYLEQIVSIRDTGFMRKLPLFRTLFCLCGLMACVPVLQAQPPEEGFFDRWALTIPDGRAGWLEVTKEDSYYDASILWGGGSVVPVDSVVFSDDNTCCS